MRPYARKALIITPSDSVDLDIEQLQIVSGTGALSVVDQDGDTLTIPSVSDGFSLPLKIKRVKATGTSASLVILGYQY